MRYWIFIFLMIMGLNSHSLYGKESNLIITSHDQASIITATDSYANQSQLLLGLRLRLHPDWHTYWINPGDAGDAATVRVKIKDDPQEVIAKIEWPVPQQLLENGLTSYIYKGDVVLPFYLTIPTSYYKHNLHLTLKANWLVCSDVCVPEQGDFFLDLPIGGNSKAKEAILLENALAQKPEIVKTDVNITPTGTLWFNKSDISLSDITKAWFMPETNGIINQDKKQQLLFHSQYFQLKLPLLSKEKLKALPTGILALQTENKHTVYWSVQPKLKKFPSALSKIDFFIWIGSAFLGGCLLNLMPCVFPVIAMKLLSLSRMKEKQVIYRYKSSLAYTTGILLCFMVIAFSFNLLRWFGHQFGWGFQFQSVGFLITLCWLLFIIALNFLNVFTVNLTFNFSKQSSHTSYLSDFLTGILAVLVATPCTAPFMGVAVAAALNTSWIMSLFIFISMGLGLAFPYLILAFIPFLMRFLPKPGIWMEILRQFLAFPLLVSCVWLVWVIYQHQQSFSLLLVLLGSVLIGFTAWLYGTVQHILLKRNIYFLRKLVIIFVIFIFIFLGISLTFIDQWQTQSLVSNRKENTSFSLSKLEQLRANHQPVFINMTASWCLTCLMNDKVALSSEKVRHYFQEKHINYMIGDWTNRNDEISQFLQKFGREGVPLYIYYPPYGKPIILPQILTPEIVIKNLHFTGNN